MSSLSGMRVVDLTQHFSGPYCTMILGDMGADVIKIEKSEGGDDQRKLGPFLSGESSPFMIINRNKRSVRLNLKTEKGRRILYKLAKNADVFIENFRPGTAASLQIDYTSIKAFNPEIIYCSISGYGQTGPDKDKGGFDVIAQAMTGLMDLNSGLGERPRKTPISLHDASAGLVALYSILGAYIHKLKCGQGQYIDVSLIESGLSLATQEASAFFGNGRVPKTSGTRHHLAAPYQAYRCRDGYVIVGAGTQRLWERFCHKVVERPDWIDDPRFATVTDRVAHIDDLEALLESVLLERDRNEWVERLASAGVPGGPINSIEQAFCDPQIIARNVVRKIKHPVVGEMKTLGFPAKMSLTPGTIRRPAPVLGQHTDEVLQELLNETEESLEDLRNSDVI